MDREKAKQLLPIIQAYAEGKTIQLKRLDGTWVDFEPEISKDIGINFENGEHRIKPEENFNDIVEVDHFCNCKGCKYISLESVDEPCCNCIDFDKYEKEEKTRPFKDCDELVKCWEKKTFIPSVMFTEDTRNRLYRPLIWVKSKEYGTDNLITAFDGNNESIGGSCVFIQDQWFTLQELYENFVFLDGSCIGAIL
jgi:hypothetical protein